MEVLAWNNWSYHGRQAPTRIGDVMATDILLRPAALLIGKPPQYLEGRGAEDLRKIKDYL